VPEHPRNCLDDGKGKHDARPLPGSAHVVVGDALVEASTNRRGDEGLRAHPGDAVDRSDDQRLPLLAGRPEQVARRRPEVWVPRVVV